MAKKEDEIWKPISEYEDKYMISSWGNVVSLNYCRTNKKKELSLRNDRGGYLMVSLCKHGIVRQFKVHRLVGLYFVPNPNNLPEINHKTGDKKNNYYKDLEWTSRLGNILHSLETGLKPRTTEKQRAAVRLTNFKKWGIRYEQNKH